MARDRLSMAQHDVHVKGSLLAAPSSYDVQRYNQTTGSTLGANLSALHH